MVTTATTSKHSTLIWAELVIFWAVSDCNLQRHINYCCDATSSRSSCCRLKSFPFSAPWLIDMNMAINHSWQQGCVASIHNLHDSQVNFSGEGWQHEADLLSCQITTVAAWSRDLSSYPSTAAIRPLSTTTDAPDIFRPGRTQRLLRMTRVSSMFRSGKYHHLTKGETLLCPSCCWLTFELKAETEKNTDQIDEAWTMMNWSQWRWWSSVDQLPRAAAAAEPPSPQLYPREPWSKQTGHVSTPARWVKLTRRRHGLEDLLTQGTSSSSCLPYGELNLFIEGWRAPKLLLASRSQKFVTVVSERRAVSVDSSAF